MSSPSDKRNAKRTMTEEDKQIFRVGGMLAVGSLLFMATMTILVHFDSIRLYPSSMNPDLVKGYAGRVEFALRYQTLLVSWLMFNILATLYGRITRGSINPLDDKTEHRVQSLKNILVNSFEQIVLSIFAQLIYLSFASPECILKVIPLVNILQFVGRIAFFAGYPLKRSFGYVTTQVPTLILVVYNQYKFFSFLGLY